MAKKKKSANTLKGTRTSSRKKTARKTNSVAKANHVHKIQNEALTQNLITLQKIMVDFSSKFEGLTNQISKLVELFESSAKSIAEKDFKEDKKIKDQLDNLVDQNKIIAKGLTLLHETAPQMPESLAPPIHSLESPMNPSPPPIKSLPQRPAPTQAPPAQILPPQIEPINIQPTASTDTYEKSVSSDLKPLPKAGEPQPQTQGEPLQIQQNTPSEGTPPPTA